jgi:hypothetical protein
VDPEEEPRLRTSFPYKGKVLPEYGPQDVAGGHGLVWSNSLPWSDGVARSNRWLE